jgi:hypothetical protein
MPSFKRSNMDNRSTDNRYHRNEMEDNSRPQGMIQSADDEDTVGSEDWNPTTQTYEWFVVRDVQLATRNIKKLFDGSGALTVRQIKESSLHSVDCIQRVLASLIASGKVVEDNGRYSLIG